MAANHHPSPPMQVRMHHAPQGPPPPPPGPAPQNATYMPSRQIAVMNEMVWVQIGNLAEVLGNPDEAVIAYEHALRHNPQSIPAMNAISLILRAREEFAKAAEYLHQILKIDGTNGEAWGSLGHCYLMLDDLQQAYSAYQTALVNLSNPKDPRLWYGIGILYDRYGSLDHAEEAFSQVMQMDPSFDKAHEIYFRLGIIYKQQQKYNQSLECFKYIVNSPPNPLTEEDIWFQIGHVHEQHKDYDNAKAAYQRVLERDPNHAKVLQQLGWLHHQQSNSFSSQERAIEYLEKSVAADNGDAQSWYLLGRCYMSQQKYPKAYEAYQQAVYRDGRNPTFWCSIGVLYYQINQYRDALDAYSRAIRLNPFISEVWYDLGTLYESCNNQINDALDAYQRAAELDPGNPHIKARLQLLRNGGANGVPPGQAPMPTDVHPQAYQDRGAVGPPGPQWAGSAPQQPQPANGPPPAPPGPNGWGRISDVNPPPQPPNPYAADREGFRGGPTPALPRQPSPRSQEQMRPYGEPNRPGPIRRGPTPPPPQPPHYAPPPLQQPPPAAPASQPRERVPNPNYGGPSPSAAAIPPGSSVNGPGPMPPNALMYQSNSPRNDGRPVLDNRMPSPKSAYPQHQPPYPPHPEQAGPEPGPPLPPPPQHPMAPEAVVHREHDPRPPSAPPKRMREWEDEREVKKPASEENRARMDDLRHRRPSTPPGEPYRRTSPPEGPSFDSYRRIDEQQRADDRRRIDELRRVDEQRHANEPYHPSEAAHHPHSAMPPHLAPIQQGPTPMQGLIHEGPPAGPVAPPEERQRLEHPPPVPHPPIVNEPERAARKMDVDEDYDDSGEDDKKVASGPGSTAGDQKTTTPTSAGINGMMNAKAEGV